MNMKSRKTDPELTVRPGVVTLTVVDALPLAKLEGLLERRHVFSVNGVPVSGEIIHLDENVSLRS